jgi:hypothetical protein
MWQGVSLRQVLACKSTVGNNQKLGLALFRYQDVNLDFKNQLTVTV